MVNHEASVEFRKKINAPDDPDFSTAADAGARQCIRCVYA